MEKYTYISIYAVTLLFGIFYYKKYNHNLQLKLWVLFLGYSFVNEIIGFYFAYVLSVRNYVISNTWFLVSAFFYMFFFLNSLKSPTKRKLIISFISIFAIYNIISILFYRDYQSQYFVDSYILGEFLIVLTILLYYFELLSGDSILNLKYSLFFWISIGALIFNIGLIPVYVIAELINYQGIFRYIILGLNIVMIISFISGFIVSKKEFNN